MSVGIKDSFKILNALGISVKPSFKEGLYEIDYKLHIIITDSTKSYLIKCIKEKKPYKWFGNYESSNIITYFDLDSANKDFDEAVKLNHFTEMEHSLYVRETFSSPKIKLVLMSDFTTTKDGVKHFAKYIMKKNGIIWKSDEFKGLISIGALI